MTLLSLERQTLLPRPLDEVFAFFSQAGNLERLTPPWLSFEVLTPPERMAVGTRISYRLRLRGLPVRWESEITSWDPPHRFVDEQRRGPYRSWHHEHLFREVPGGTEVVDRVRYSVLGGRVVDRFLVAPDLRRIFDFRQAAMHDIFGGPEVSAEGSAGVPVGEA